MAITKRVQGELVQATPASIAASASPRRRRGNRKVTATRSTSASATGQKSRPAASRTTTTTGSGQAWSPAEHQRFVEALQLFPAGPWRTIADHVGTKTPRQTMTHAQKYREKHDRHQRGLRTKTKAKVTKKGANRQASRKTPGGRSQTTAGERVAGVPAQDSRHLQHRSIRRNTCQAVILQSHCCTDVRAATAGDLDDCINSSPSPLARGSPLFTLPDALFHAAVDMWQLHSLSDVVVGETEPFALELDDLHDFAAGFSQEC